MEKNKPEVRLTWIHDLINFGGAIVGIVLTAIGGVMFLNTSLKLYVFRLETNPYFSFREMCDDEFYGKPYVEPGQMVPPKKTEEEIQDCMNKRLEIEKKSFRRQQQENFIQGTAFLIVGAFFWILHRRRKKKLEN